MLSPIEVASKHSHFHLSFSTDICALFHFIYFMELKLVRVSGG